MTFVFILVCCESNPSISSSSKNYHQKSRPRRYDDYRNNLKLSRQSEEQRCRRVQQMAEAQKLLESNCLSDHPSQPTRSLQRHHGENHNSLNFQHEKDVGGRTKEDMTFKASKDTQGKSSFPPHTPYDTNRNRALTPRRTDYGVGIHKQSYDDEQDFYR